MEPIASLAEPRVWRPTWPGRATAVVFFVAFVAMAIVWLVAGAPVGWLHLLALLPAAAAVIPLRIAGAKVVLAPDSVLVRNPFDVHRVALDQIVSVTNLPRGAVEITTAGGAVIEVCAVHTPMLAWISGRRSRANELMEAIEDAALACGAVISPSRLRHAVRCGQKRQGRHCLPAGGCSAKGSRQNGNGEPASDGIHAAADQRGGTHRGPFPSP